MSRTVMPLAAGTSVAPHTNKSPRWYDVVAGIRPWSLKSTLSWRLSTSAPSAPDDDVVGFNQIAVSAAYTPTAGR